MDLSSTGASSRGVAMQYLSHNCFLQELKNSFVLPHVLRTEYVGSDKPLNGGTAERPDLIVFDNPVLFRGDNSLSNRVSIFEFKRLDCNSVVILESRNDPIDQIISYANRIRNGECKTVGGCPIQVTENTPF